MNDPRHAAPRLQPSIKPSIQPAVAQDMRVEQLVELACALEAQFALTLLSLLYADPEAEEDD